MVIKESTYIFECQNCQKQLEIDLDFTLSKNVERKLQGRLMGQGWKVHTNKPLCSELCLVRYKETVYEQ